MTKAYTISPFLLQRDSSATLPCPMCATSSSTSCSRGEIKNRSWQPRRTKCSSTGRSTATRRKRRKRPSGPLSSTAHPPIRRTIAIIPSIRKRTAVKPSSCRSVGRAGSRDPTSSKSSVGLALPPFDIFHLTLVAHINHFVSLIDRAIRRAIRYGINDCRTNSIPPPFYEYLPRIRWIYPLLSAYA